MKVKTHRQGGYSSGNITEERGDLYGSVTLHQDPVLDLQAANVSYVDQKADSIPAGRFATGETPKETLPVLTGDVIKLEATDTVVIAPIGIPNNSTHSKVTINSKGQVIGSGVFIESDIPELPFSHVETNKPTTVEGYGITNALKEDGGEFTGTLKVTEVSEDNNSLANLTFLETQSSGEGGSGVSVGGVIYRNSPTTPTGFLKCNGGEVSRSVYPALYSVIGEQFAVADKPTFGGEGGKPWMCQYNLNTTQTSSTITWTELSPLPFNVSLHQIVVTKNAAFLIGGRNETDYQTAIYKAEISATGILGNWVLHSHLPEPIGQAQAVVVDSVIYLMGGRNNIGQINTVYKCAISENGDLGNWVLHNTLPTTLAIASAIVTSSRIYLLGGYHGTTITNNVIYAELDENNVPGEWQQAPNLPSAVSHSQAIITKDRVYLISGWNGSAAINTTLTAPINAQGVIGTWANGTTLALAQTLAQAVVVRSRVYLLGNGSQSAPIDSNGIIGTWTTTNATPGTTAAKRGRQVVITNSKLYLVGGEAANGSTVHNNIYETTFVGGLNEYTYQRSYATINSGFGKPWENLYGYSNYNSNDIGPWEELSPMSNSGMDYTLARSQTVVTKDKLLLVGGNSSQVGTTGTTYKFNLNSDGTVLNTNTDTNTLAVHLHQAVVAKNYIYITGGINSSGSPVNAVRRVPINADGTLGTLEVATALPYTVYGHRSFVSRDKLYVIGGVTNSVYGALVYYAPIAGDGTLGSWVQVTGLPTALASFSLAVVKNKIYLIGGSTSSNTPSVVVYKATIDANGFIGSWSISIPLPEARTDAQVIVTNNKIYLLGGSNAPSAVGRTSTVYVGSVDADGNLLGWSLSQVTLPIPLIQAGVAVVNNYLYLIGGVSGSFIVNRVFRAPFTGGVNDYTPYYNGVKSYIVLKPTFNLPNLTPNTSQSFAYIKY